MSSDNHADGAQRSWLTSKQFWMWLGVVVPAFVVVSTALGAIEPPYGVALAVGILFNEALEPVMDWLQDWQQTEKEVEKHGV